MWESLFFSFPKCDKDVSGVCVATCPDLYLRCCSCWCWMVLRDVYIRRVLIIWANIYIQYIKTVPFCPIAVSYSTRLLYVTISLTKNATVILYWGGGGGGSMPCGPGVCEGLSQLWCCPSLPHWSFCGGHILMESAKKDSLSCCNSPLNSWIKDIPSFGLRGITLRSVLPHPSVCL